MANRENVEGQQQRLEFGDTWVHVHYGVIAKASSDGLEYVIILIDALLGSLASSVKHLDLTIIVQTRRWLATYYHNSDGLPEARTRQSNPAPTSQAKPSVLLARLSPRQKKRGIVLYTVNHPNKDEKGVNNLNHSGAALIR
jgi:hypothetical protein